ncbi:carboxypeptidase C (cathepsin A) [Kibdelosporangium banguiense]|uniref:Carboxypeptidase C (Cathepsin A) n=1 Tax=Kibdelosporangium banguiense TaxID=1365924 RepID=A0ABS4TXW5_9PSEU|nr:alpha/beta hydrolase [Kibdelosporangium banguiense]MBP2329245.1 carboxypeptidase C (cathepsin A) [Kibdelosporangium banguiense]
MRHTATIGGVTLDYTAQWEQLVLAENDGTPNAVISATSYQVVTGEPRPVMFLFNGGPGASSSPLHMSAFGPKRFVGDPVSGQRTIIPNEFCLLDRVDLVFIDPVGTGFSRELREGGATPYMSIHGDSAAVEQFIRHWLAEHKRSDSPVYLVGESFGGFRLATLCARIADLGVAGLVFVSPMLDASASWPSPGNDLPHVFQLPAIAVAAWQHKCASAHAHDAVTVFDETQRFAETDYLRALHLGSALPAADRAAVADFLAELTGLPQETVIADDLRIDSEKFLRTLLADRDELVGRLDTRVTGPMPPPATDDRPPAADDPALGIGRSNVILSDQIADYLRAEAGAGVDGTYVSLSLDIHFAFDWRNDHPRPEFYTNPTPNVAELIRARPKSRVLLLGGYFDLSTPLAASVFALRHSGLPPSSLDICALAAGHSLDDDDTLRTAGAAIRAVIDATLEGQP